MNYIETKIIIDLDEILTTFDYGHLKNTKSKSLLTLAKEKKWISCFKEIYKNT